MTKHRARALFAELQEQMLLSHWDIELLLDEHPPDNTSDADCWRANLYDHAKIRLDKGWRRWDETRFRQVLAHELGHVLTRDLEEGVFDMKPFVGELEWEPFRQRWHQEIEGVVDRYARILIGGR